jgi:uncharacterized repeat protein (TIGR01451 family)
VRTLTDVFAAGATALPEGLRTLQVSPISFVEPGQTVHATFAFRNLGGGIATGFRVRFRLPEGLTYLVGTARIDATPVDEQGGLTALLHGSGADIGEIAPGAERRISLDYTVVSTIEDGTQIAIQAAIASFEVPVIGSNVVRLVVRSKPLLRNPKTIVSVSPVREVTAGEELQIRALIHNGGQSSAHDVIALLPLPAHTSYVERSARVGGREITGSSDDPFGVGRPAIVAAALAPNSTIEVAFRARVDAVIEDKTPIVVRAAIGSLETAEFSLEPAMLKVTSLPSFTGDETTFVTDCGDDVSPGQRIRIALKLRNVGTARAQRVRAQFILPDGMFYCTGSRTIDGAAVPDGDDAGTFALGELPPEHAIEVALYGSVATPSSNGAGLAFAGRIDWQNGHRAFDQTLTVRSAPSFPAAFNAIRREGARRIAPGDAATFTIAVANLGTDVAPGVRIVLDADPGLEHLRASEGDAEISIGDDGAIALDALQPGLRRTFRIDAMLAAVLEDNAQLRLGASLRLVTGENVALGSAMLQVASRPHFSMETSHLVAESSDALRPNHLIACKLVLRNDGTDRGREIRVRLQLPEELHLERVDGAAHDGDAVVLGDIAAGETRDTVIFLRLTGQVAHGDALTVLGRVGGSNVVPFSLEPLKLSTHAEASFAEGATLTSQPIDAIDTGSPIYYTLALRNGGDGAAKRLTLRLDQPSNAVYAPASTSVNGVALLDFVGTSPLLGTNGLTLGDVGVGAEVIVRMRAIVNAPLPAGTTIEARAYIAWDDGPETIVRCEPVRVRSTSALPIVEAALPFTVIDAAAAPKAITANDNGHAGAAYALNGYGAIPAALPSEALPVETALVEEPVDGPAILSLRLDEPKLAWTVRYLDEARLDGLIPDLLMLRALFPDDAAGSDPATRRRLREHAERLSELADRLFVKLRLPEPDIVAADVETTELRESLRGVLGVLRELPAGAPYEADGLRLITSLRSAELASAQAALDEAPLVTAEPWLATALLLGSTLEFGGHIVEDIGTYRAALRRELTTLRDLDTDAFLEAVLSRPVDAQLAESRDRALRALAAQRDPAR